MSRLAPGIVCAGAVEFSPFSTQYLTPGEYTVPVPSGAATVQIDGYGPGQRGLNIGGNRGGGGGAFARTTVSVAGHSAIWIVVTTGPSSPTTTPDPVEARWDNSSGTLLMRAVGAPANSTSSVTHYGGDAANCIGDLTYSGGATDYNAGGGGAGPNGPGLPATSNSAPGAGNGGLAGAGGNNSDGVQCGGGGARTLGGGLGGRGGIEIFWT